MKEFTIQLGGPKPSSLSRSFSRRSYVLRLAHRQGKKMQVPLPSEQHTASSVPGIYLCMETQDRGSGVPSLEWVHNVASQGTPAFWPRGGCTHMCTPQTTTNPTEQKDNQPDKKPAFLLPLKKYWNLRKKHTFAFQILTRALWQVSVHKARTLEA